MIVRRKLAKREMKNLPNVKQGRSGSVRKNSANMRRCASACLDRPRPRPLKSGRLLEIAGTATFEARVEKQATRTSTRLRQISHPPAAKQTHGGSCTTQTTRPSQTRRGKTLVPGQELQTTNSSQFDHHEGPTVAAEVVLLQEDAAFREPHDGPACSVFIGPSTMGTNAISGFFEDCP